MSFPMTGTCSCRGVTFEVTSAPIIVHGCHCTWCQRETGSALVINAMYEHDRVRVIAGAPVEVHTPSLSGRGQRITRCPTCHVALWSLYSSPKIRFVRAGTLADPTLFPPDIHIFTASKLPWLTLPAGVPAFAEYYPDPTAVWSAEALARRAAAVA